MIIIHSVKLSKRQRSEKKFHDDLAKSIDINNISVENAFSIGAQENRFARRLFGDIKNKRILDLGLGYGETAVYWAMNHASVYGVDISPGMVKIAKRLARKYRVSRRCRFRQMAAEKLLFRDNYFDYIFGNSVLHHVDIPTAAYEVKRVLKKGGIAVFVEPLMYNPLINIYRRLADKVRTPDEHPLSFKDLSALKKVFRVVEHREYQFLTLIIFVWFFAVGRIDPNQERYWKKLLRLDGGLKLLLHILVVLDRMVLTLFPPLKYLCWNTVIILRN